MHLVIALVCGSALAGHADDWQARGFVDGAPVRPAWRDRLARDGAPASPPPPPAPPTQRATVYGYHPYWGPDPTTLDFQRLTHLAIFAVEMESSGQLSGTDNWTQVAPAVIPLAHAAGVRVHLTLISFDDAQHAAILPHADKRAQVIQQLVELVTDHGGDGVNIDIEGMASTHRDDLVAFTQELKAALPPGQDDVVHATPAIDWSGAYDYDALCAASDGLFIMGYGYHWSGGDPGPVAPLFGGSPWSAYSLQWSVDDYLSWGAWPDCLIMGLPTYGRDWPVSGDPAVVPGDASADGDAVVMSAAVDIAAAEGRLWDTVTHTPYVIRSGSQLWYDDTDSLADKIGWSLDQGLQGVGFWALGYEGDDPDFWQMVEDQAAGADSGSPGADSGDPGDPGDPDSGDPGTYDGGGQGGEHQQPGTRTPLGSGCRVLAVRPSSFAGLVIALWASLYSRRRRPSRPASPSPSQPAAAPTVEHPRVPLPLSR